MTRLSSLPPASVAKDANDSSPPSTSTAETNGSINGGPVEATASGSGRDVRDVAEMTKTELAQERRSLLMKLFADTGTAKIPAVIR